MTTRTATETEPLSAPAAPRPVETTAPIAAPDAAAPDAAAIERQLQDLAGRRVAVALSGGVDSAVAAHALRSAGADVIALALRLHDVDPTLPRAPRACCAPDDLQDARRVAEALDVPFYVIDARNAFDVGVVEPFVSGYLAGRTPSPCVACNAQVKLGLLWQRARLLGAVALATGHYARTNSAGRLFRGVDLAKDQSYFLFATPSVVLRELVLPLGASTKADVRARALAAGLPVAHKLDSQEVCFVGGDGAKDFLRRRAGGLDGSGPIVDSAGAEVGRHDGFWQYTIGQRRGTNVASGRRLYVLGVDVSTRAVTVGEDRELSEWGLAACDVRWITAPTGPARAHVKIRSRDPGTAATIRSIEGAKVEVRFDLPVRAVAKGQAAVFYEGDEVLGGGFIIGALR
ncbi:MAG: tRNA 2-thiouridine(34) synthase MnmA [Deltaproteobacteria bacterium]|nr:tRNA 2-thiouridine(34) synthase MnmA [Deltaproteobacteria bacterium]